MTFEEILDQALAMLERRGRVTYRTLKRQFQLDEDALEDLKAEIIKGQRLAVDENGEVLVWTGGTTTPGVPAGEQTYAPLAYTPVHLAEKILASQSALEGERKQVTVLFADLVNFTGIAATVSPRELVESLGEVFSAFDDLAVRHGLEKIKTLGDGYLAVAGVPGPHPDPKFPATCHIKPRGG
jgi:hypothetical protein